MIPTDRTFTISLVRIQRLQRYHGRFEEQVLPAWACRSNPSAQPLVLVGVWALGFLGVWPSKIEVIWVLGGYTIQPRIYVEHLKCGSRTMAWKTWENCRQLCWKWCFPRIESKILTKVSEIIDCRNRWFSHVFTFLDNENRNSPHTWTQRCHVHTHPLHSSHQKALYNNLSTNIFSVGIWMSREHK